MRSLPDTSAAVLLNELCGAQFGQHVDQAGILMQLQHGIGDRFADIGRYFSRSVHGAARQAAREIHRFQVGILLGDVRRYDGAGGFLANTLSTPSFQVCAVEEISGCAMGFGNNSPRKR